MVGIDIVEIKRFIKILDKEEIMKKVFAPEEINYILGRQNKAHSAAGMFACKEAFLKAVRLGIFNGIALNNIVINHLENGAPVLKLDADVIDKFNIIKADISIAHDGGIAIAICQIENA